MRERGGKRTSSRSPSNVVPVGLSIVLQRTRSRRYVNHAVVLGLLIASLSPGCAPNAAPPAADTVTPTPAPIGTVVTPVSAVLSLTPIAAPPTGVVLVLITTVTPGGTV